MLLISRIGKNLFMARLYIHPIHTSFMKELEELDVSWSMEKTVSVITAALASAEEMFSMGKKAEAKELFESAVKKVLEAEEYFWRPLDSDEVYLRLKKLSMSFGDNEAAKNWEGRINLRRAREIEFVARVQNFCGNNTLALEYYNQALALVPDFELAKEGKEKAEKSLGKAKREVDLAENMVKKMPSNGDALLKLGMIYLNLNRMDEAIENLKRAVELAKDKEEATMRLGLAYLSAGKYREAKECFEKVLAIKGSSLNAKRGKNYANYFLGIEEA